MDSKFFLKKACKIPVKIDLSNPQRALSLFVLLFLSLLGIVLYSTRLKKSAAAAPKLSNAADSPLLQPFPRTAVIIPAYNEAINIRDCAIAALQSAVPDLPVEVWVVDDRSTDETLAIAQSLQQELGDPRLKVLAGQPRPVGEVWAGKNWACAQAAEAVSSDFILFIDADVRLKPGAIVSAVTLAQQESIDLLTCWPQVICSCFAEWLVQPIIITILAIGFDFAGVNDPQSDVAFGAGPFMLFRRSAYDKIGGHRALASEIVEDVELARKIKSKGLRLRYLLGREVAQLQMYRSWGALWEGWTKNWYLGSHRNLRLTLYMAGAVLLVCTFPWLALGILMAKGAIASLDWFDLAALVLALVNIGYQYYFRLIGEQVCQIQPKYWWLTGIGGVAVAAIAIASIIKTETGWGWTWRGRSLQLPS